MTNNSVKICILGGGFGGLYTALYLSRFSAAKKGIWQITLVERKDHFLFTPLLYELITGELQPWEIAPSYQKLLRHSNIKFCQDKVEGIELKTRQIKVKNGEELTYDYLVLAVGTQNRWADVPGAATYALTFRTLKDVESLQGRLSLLECSGRQHIRIAVIGGGPNGVELACKLADRLGRRGQVQLIERGQQILKGFPNGLRAAAQRALQARHIQVQLETSIAAIEAEQITIVQDGQIIILPIDLVLWTAGTQSLDWLSQLECQCNSQCKIITLPTLQLVDYPEVFALGDLADIYNSKKPVPATAQAAYQQASCAAYNIKADLTGKRLRCFHYLHLGDMLTLGKGAAVVSSFSINIEGALAAIIRRLVYIQRLPTLRHRLQVFKNLFMNYQGRRQKVGKEEKYEL